MDQVEQDKIKKLCADIIGPTQVYGDELGTPTIAEAVEYLTNYTKELEKCVVNNWPVCNKCGAKFYFESREPFANCNCCTTECCNSGNIYRRLQLKFKIS